MRGPRPAETKIPKSAGKQQLGSNTKRPRTSPRVVRVHCAPFSAHAPTAAPPIPKTAHQNAEIPTAACGSCGAGGLRLPTPRPASCCPPGTPLLPFRSARPSPRAPRHPLSTGTTLSAPPRSPSKQRRVGARRAPPLKITPPPLCLSRPQPAVAARKVYQRGGLAPSASRELVSTPTPPSCRAGAREAQHRAHSPRREDTATRVALYLFVPICASSCAPSPRACAPAARAPHTPPRRTCTPSCRCPSARSRAPCS